MKGILNLNKRWTEGAVGLLMVSMLFVGCSGTKRNQQIIADSRYAQYMAGQYNNPSNLYPDRAPNQGIQRGAFAQGANGYQIQGLQGRGGVPSLIATNRGTPPCVPGMQYWVKESGKAKLVEADCGDSDSHKKKKEKKRSESKEDEEEDDEENGGGGGSGDSGDGDDDDSDDTDKKFKLAKKAHWEQKCTDDQKASAMSDIDGIPDDCEIALQGLYPALDIEEDNGYKIAGIKLDIESVKTNLRALDIDPSKLNILDNLKGRSALNQAIAELIMGLASPEKSTIRFINTLYKSAAERYPVAVPIKEGIEGIGFVHGGYDDPILLNQNETDVGSKFSVSMLGGIAENIPSLSEGDSYLYIAEAYIHAPKNESALKMRLSTADGARASGTFMVFVNGNLEIDSLDLSKIKGRENKAQANVVPNTDGKIQGGQWQHLVIALLGQQVQEEDVKTIIRENVIIERAGGKENEWELFPQEIARVNQPTGFKFRKEFGDDEIIIVKK